MVGVCPATCCSMKHVLCEFFATSRALLIVVCILLLLYLESTFEETLSLQPTRTLAAAGVARDMLLRRGMRVVNVCVMYGVLAHVQTIAGVWCCIWTAGGGSDEDLSRKRRQHG
eukprot:m.370615 g.370615  ORF g.370615 m.370615 type:complete len:114 (-) comp20861_c0_seq14:1496-1837(-)